MKQRSGLIPTLITTAALMCSSNLFAEEGGVDDDVLRNLFQRLEVYLGVMQANEREHQNLIRSVPAPAAEQSAAAGDGINALENGAEINEKALAGSALWWNMLQPTEDISNTSIVSRHIAGYCSSAEADAGICSQGLSVDEGGAADLLADTLLANSTVSQLNSAMAFVYMLTNPSPIPLPENAFQSKDQTAEIKVSADTPMAEKLGADQIVKARPLTSEGVRTLAARYKQMALLSTAQFALNTIAAERSAPSSGGISAFEALKIEAERRFKSAAWHQEINTLPDTALLREMATMQALQLALDFKRYEQEQIMLTLLAAQVSTNAQTLGAGEAAYQMQ